MILLHLKTFWEVPISFTKLPAVHSRNKARNDFMWHIPEATQQLGSGEKTIKH